MTSKKEAKETGTSENKPVAKRRRLPPGLHTAEEKAQAVLAIWTERVKVAAVMRELGVTYMALQQWQERALEGMLQALEPRTNLANGAALSPRLRMLLQRRQTPPTDEKMKSRLQRLQEIASGTNPPSTP